MIDTPITSGSRALDLFTDRTDLIRTFASLVNEPSSSASIIYLPGDGGVGKTLLLKFLRRYVCKRLAPETWHNILTKNEEGFIEQIRTTPGDEIATSFLDFGSPPRGDDRPFEAFSALAMIRRNLAGHDLTFPLYTFASIWYLKQTGRLGSANLQSLFPSEELDLVSNLVNVLAATSWGSVAKAILQLFDKHLRDRLILYAKRRHLDEDLVDSIQTLDPEYELLDQLPILFGMDLKAALEIQSERVALFFDTHEAFWGSDQGLSDDLYFQRDEWLRRLVYSLLDTPGVIVVVAGRDQPRWSHATSYPIPASKIKVEVLGNLARSDGNVYLKKAGITDPHTRTQILDYCAVEDSFVHPLYLGLCADVVLTAAMKGFPLQALKLDTDSKMSEKEKVLLDRLLRYVNVEIAHAVRSLSAARVFNREIYYFLGSTLHFLSTAASFSQLVQFSFVQRVEQRGVGWYTVHSLIRRFLRQQADGIQAQANVKLREYYSNLAEQGDLSAYAEAIYHHNRMDWRAGINEWIKMFEYWVRIGNLESCGILYGVLNDLYRGDGIEYLTTLRLEGSYLYRLGRQTEALRKFTEALETGNQIREGNLNEPEFFCTQSYALLGLGLLHHDMSNRTQALELYEEVLISAQRSLELTPNATRANDARGRALQQLGSLAAGRSQYDEAKNYYAAALQAFDAAIQEDDTFLPARHNKGTLLNSMGNLFHELSEYNDEQESFDNAILCLAEALSLEPDSALTHVALGTSYLSLGRMFVEIAGPNRATANFIQAIREYDLALSLSPQLANASSGKARTLFELGALSISISKFADAAKWYREAADISEAWRRRTPRDPAAHNFMGMAVRNLARSEGNLRKFDDALEHFRRAIRLHDEALRFEPGFTAAYLSKAQTLRDNAKLCIRLDRFAEAAELLTHAIESADLAIKNNDAANGCIQNSLSFESLGDLSIRKHDYSAALENFTTGVESCDQGLTHAPNYHTLHNNRGFLLQRMGDAQTLLLRRDDALGSYTQSLIALNEGLKRSPNRRRLAANKARTLWRMSGLYVSLGEYKKALSSCEEAVALFDDLIEAFPEYTNAYLNKGIYERWLGECQAGLCLYDDATISYLHAANFEEKVEKLEAGHVLAQAELAQAIGGLGYVQLATSKYEEAVGSFLRSNSIADEVIAQSPQNHFSQSTKLAALRGLGSAKIRLSQYREALSICENANDYSKQTIADWPYYSNFYAQRAMLLWNLGQLEVMLTLFAEAEVHLQESVTISQKSLRLDPAFFVVYDTWGTALSSLGFLYNEMSQPKKATEVLQQSVDVYSEGNQRAPNNPRNLSNALRRLGEARFAMGDHSGARETYLEAIKSCDLELHRVPNNAFIHETKALSLTRLAQLENIANKNEASAIYSEAFNSFDQALRIAPRYAVAMAEKAEAMTSLAEALITIRNDQIKGQELLRGAIVLCGETMKIAPDLLPALGNKAYATSLLANLSSGSEQKEKLRIAMTLYDRYLSIAPNHKKTRARSAIVRQVLMEQA